MYEINGFRNYLKPICEYFMHKRIHESSGGSYFQIQLTWVSGCNHSDFISQSIWDINCHGKSSALWLVTRICTQSAICVMFELEILFKNCAQLLFPVQGTLRSHSPSSFPLVFVFFCQGQSNWKSPFTFAFAFTFRAQLKHSILFAYE